MRTRSQNHFHSYFTSKTPYSFDTRGILSTPSWDNHGRLKMTTNKVIRKRSWQTIKEDNSTKHLKDNNFYLRRCVLTVKCLWKSWVTNKTYPRRPRGSQSVGRKFGTKVFKYGQKSPWVPTLTELFPKIQADATSWMGTKNALYYCAQSANSFSWVLFVSSYTMATVSPQLPGSFTKLVRARKTST